MKLLKGMSDLEREHNSMKDFREKIGNILLFLGSTMLAILIAELTVRIFDIPPRPLAPLPVCTYQLSENPVIGYEFIPGYKSPNPPCQSIEQYVINDAGFRDYEYAPKKPAGVYRVVVLGDSTTAGNGISDIKKIYTKQLEELLNTNSDNHVRFEVLNMGVGGYHTMQEIETLRTKGLKFNPDLVLLALCLNDFNLYADGGVMSALYKANEGHHASWGSTPAWIKSLCKSSRMAFIIYQHLNRNTIRNDYYDWYKHEVLKDRSPVRAGFISLSELQQKYGFSVIVLILPDFRMRAEKYKRMNLHKSVHAAAKDLFGLTIIDLLKNFSNLDKDLNKFAFDGCHLNEDGHRIMAHILLPIVMHQQALLQINNRVKD